MNLSIKLTQLNGLVGDIFDILGGWVSNLIGALFGRIAMILYQFFVVPLFLIADAIQIVFKKIAGLDTYYVDGQSQSGDIVLSLINNQTVQNVFWALLILGVVLLIICTIISLIRAETQSIDDKNRKSKSKIFSDAIRALFNFFMVPVVAILGIFMGNALLKSLDEATSGSSGNRISTIVFRTAAYDCNRARLYEKFALDIRDEGYNSMGVLKGSDQEEIADAIDSAFEKFTQFGGWKILSLPVQGLFSDGGNVYFHTIALTIFSRGTAYVPRYCFSIYDAEQVYYYYDLASFNYLIGIVGMTFVIYVLFVTAIGLIKRIFKLTILLIVSPPIVAISPLDNGTALGKWKKQFLGSTLSAYSTVVSLNLVFLLLGPVSNIKFFGSSNAIVGIASSFLNNIITLLITIGALLFFKDFSKMLADMIGAENAYEDGGKVASEMAKKAAKGAMTATGAAAGFKAMKKAKMMSKASISTDRALKDLKERKKNGDTSVTDDMIEKKEALLKSQQEQQANYDNLAREQLNRSKNAFMSLATNGISDGVVKDIQDFDKLHGHHVGEAKERVAKNSEVTKGAFRQVHPKLAKVNRGLKAAGKMTANAAAPVVGKVMSTVFTPYKGVNWIGSKIGGHIKKSRNRALKKESRNELLDPTERNLAGEKHELNKIKDIYGENSPEYEKQMEKVNEAKKLNNERLKEEEEKRKAPLNREKEELDRIGKEKGKKSPEYQKQLEIYNSAKKVYKEKSKRAKKAKKLLKKL